MESARQLVSILAVFALLGFALWAARRGGFARLGLTNLRGVAGERDGLLLLERLPLTPQHVLHVVRIRGRELVVATHPQGCVLLTDAEETKRQ
jgi:flagellar biogenesis protein FliO